MRVSWCLLGLLACAGSGTEVPGDTSSNEDSDPPETDSGDTADSAEPFSLSCTDPQTVSGWDGREDFGPNPLVEATPSGDLPQGLANFTWSFEAYPGPFAPDLIQHFGARGISVHSVEFPALFSGTYRVRGEALDSGGVVASCTGTVDIARSGLSIELMSLTDEFDDFDLHVVRGDGELRTTDDCYYATCQNGSPDWGQASVSADDPTLYVGLVDAENNEGMWETDILVLEQPEFADFHIWVHDYPGAMVEDARSFRVRIWADGVQLAQFDRTVTGDDTETLVAHIAWPTLVVTEAR